MNSWTVTLPPELADVVREQLAKQSWDSPDMLFAYAIGVMQSHLTLEDSLDEDWLRAELQNGIEQLDRGEGLDGPTAMARLREKLHSATTAS